MIKPPTDLPLEAEDLEVMIPEAVRQMDEVRELTEGLDHAASIWRPEPKKWSVAGHIAHLVIVNREYIAAMTQAAADGQRRRILGEGPYKHGWIGSWFARIQDPPPRFRMRTMRRMVPDPEAGRPVEEFVALQKELARLMGSAKGLDLGRVRFPSPFFGLLRFSLGAGFHLVLAHNRRHIWAAEQVTKARGFPG